MARTPRDFNPRACGARIVAEVAHRGRTLDAVLAETFAGAPAPAERALIQEMAYGTLRWFHQLAAIAALFLEKPLKPKDADVHALLLLGLYQLRHMRVAPHAAVKETVEAAAALGKPRTKGLLNACLRAYLRAPVRVRTLLEKDPVAAYSHPAWLIESLRHDHPDTWPRILAANNERPPMTLRVNFLRSSRAAYLERLRAADLAARAHDAVDSAVVLDSPVAVTELPGFAEGLVSVQDAAAQLAAVLLDARAGERVLDACAAPGGKTAHILERGPRLAELMALDMDPARAALIEDNLNRLRLSARVRVGDASTPAAWWEGRAFDRILADVPCSATGVIRRHPDIKLRRTPGDLPKLIENQARLLDGLWPLLRPGGKLLYVTCSVLAGENEDRVGAFLAQHEDATECALPTGAGAPRRRGRQILPGEEGMDGFYYACLRKN
jgi:16S rRNA (cytosine967-C5)-methyltransferase